MLIENCMAIADRITIVICIIDFIIECIVTIDIFRNYDKEREGEKVKVKNLKKKRKKKYMDLSKRDRLYRGQR